MTLSFGASTFSYIRRESALTSMRRLRAIGYRTFDVLAVPGHFWPSELDHFRRPQLRRELERDDVVLESLNPQPVDLNLGSSLREVRAFSVATYTDMVRLAVDLGALDVVVVPGRVAALPPSIEETSRWVADSLAKLVEVARREGLRHLLLENHPATAYPTATAVVHLIDRVGADNLKVAYDVANAEYVGEEQISTIRTIGSRLGQTHLSDARRSQWAHDPPGSGTVPFGAILAVLAEEGFTGTNVVEIISANPSDDFTSAARALGIPLSPGSAT